MSGRALRINEDFNGPYLENENEFFKNSSETVFRASKSRDRVSAFQLTFKNYVCSFSSNIDDNIDKTRKKVGMIFSSNLDRRKVNPLKYVKF